STMGIAYACGDSSNSARKSMRSRAPRTSMAFCTSLISISLSDACCLVDFINEALQTLLLVSQQCHPMDHESLPTPVKFNDSEATRNNVHGVAVRNLHQLKRTPESSAAAVDAHTQLGSGRNDR